MSIQDRPVDSRALARHAVRFSGELEKAWSESLSEVLGTSGDQQVQAEFGALMRSVMAEMDQGPDRFRKIGIDLKSSGGSLSRDSLISLLALKSEDAPTHRAMAAYLIQISSVAKSINSIQTPTGRSEDLGSSQRLWFEAGAFEMLRNRAEALFNVASRMERIELDAQSVGPKPPVPAEVSYSFEQFRFAVLSRSHGDFDASIMHLHAAIRGVIATAAKSELGLIQKPARVLSRLPGMKAIGPALETLDDLAEKVGRVEVDIEEAILVVETLEPLVRELVANPPLRDLAATLDESGD